VAGPYPTSVAVMMIGGVTVRWLNRNRALAFERRSGVEAAVERRLIPDAGERAADRGDPVWTG
jgi:hypothetical protein